jgi:hypothetical protein
MICNQTLAKINYVGDATIYSCSLRQNHISMQADANKLVKWRHSNGMLLNAIKANEK